MEGYLLVRAEWRSPRETVRPAEISRALINVGNPLGAWHELWMLEIYT